MQIRDFISLLAQLLGALLTAQARCIDEVERRIELASTFPFNPNRRRSENAKKRYQSSLKVSFFPFVQKCSLDDFPT